MKEKNKLNIPMFLLIVLLAANMRACYTGVGTIVGLIQSDLGLNGTLAGMITTIPIIVFAFVCPLSSSLSEKYGLGRMIELALVFIAVGIVLRAIAGSLGLFGGTTLLAVGVGIMNAVMVGLIKLRFPAHTGAVTSAYTTTMALTSAVAMGINVPMADLIGWRGVMAMWVILAIPAILLWAPQSGKEFNRGAAASGEKGLTVRMLRSAQAWYLMLFMGTQSMLFYCISAWVPSILQWKGMTAAEAAVTATALQVLSLPSTLLFPILAEKFNWRKLILIFDFAYILGAVVFFFAGTGKGALWVAIVLLAMGVGSGFSACVFLFSKKARSPAEAAAISGFAQSGGYVFAAIGPVLMGWLYDLTGNWNAGMFFCFAVILAMTVFSALSAGRERVL